MPAFKFYQHNELSPSIIQPLANNISIAQIVQLIPSAIIIKNRTRVNANNNLEVQKLKKLLDHFPPQKRGPILNSLVALVKKPEIYNFIKNNQIDVKDILSTKDTIQKYVNKQLSNNLDTIVKYTPIKLERRKDGKTIPAVRNRELDIYLSQIKCNQLTDGFLGGNSGNDEISYGLISTDELGNTFSDVRIEGLSFGDKSDEKEVNFNPPLLVHKFPINDNYINPKYFTFTNMLAEVDFGGFGSFANEVYDLIKGQICTALINVGISAGGSAGAYIVSSSVGGSILGPVGMLVGAIVAIISYFIIGAIIEAMKDDIFNPIVFGIGFNDPISTFKNGSLKDKHSETFNQFGGSYTVTLNLELKRD